MSPAEFVAACEAARISRRALAEWMGYRTDTPIQRMADGRKQVPDGLADWLRRRASDAPPRIDG